MHGHYTSWVQWRPVVIKSNICGKKISIIVWMEIDMRRIFLTPNLKLLGIQFRRVFLSSPCRNASTCTPWLHARTTLLIAAVTGCCGSEWTRCLGPYVSCDGHGHGRWPWWGSYSFFLTNFIQYDIWLLFCVFYIYKWWGSYSFF